jgi:hypothetical protein
MKVSTEEELGKAIKDGENYIEVEHNLRDKVTKIKAVGNVAWPIAFGALVVLCASAYVIVAPPGANLVGPPAALGSAGIAIAILGLAATVAAVKIAYSGSGTSTLTTLREYKMKKDKDTLILYKNDKI